MKNLNLGNFGALLGFPNSAEIQAKTVATSPKSIDINLGLKYVTLNCNSIDSVRNFDRQGRRSQTLFTLPVLSNQNLSSAVSYFSNIGSTTPMNNGIFNSLTFTIGSNTNEHIGVDIYFEVIVKE